MSNPAPGSAPASMHGLVNLAVALPWMILLPIALCYFSPIPFWWAVWITPLWIFLTGRIPERVIPRFTGPIVDSFYKKREESKAWYDIPFELGQSYRVTQKILGDFETLEEGMELTYSHSGSSRYDGYIGFFFTDSNGGEHRWDIREDEDPVVEAQTRFEIKTGEQAADDQLPARS
ncbi:hypothetical protein [Haloferula sp.]|uniref:hypothetical protein n=1 Tax=Haloferula sp. TaxID=2497595 RepID=UPI00329B8B36